MWYWFSCHFIFYLYSRFHWISYSWILLWCGGVEIKVKCWNCVINKGSILVVPFGGLIYCLNWIIVKGSIFVFPFVCLISFLRYWCFWLKIFGSIFVVRFGRFISCLLSWCFCLKIFGVASNISAFSCVEFISVWNI